MDLVIQSERFAKQDASLRIVEMSMRADDDVKSVGKGSKAIAEELAVLLRECTFTRAFCLGIAVGLQLFISRQSSRTHP